MATKNETKKDAITVQPDTSGYIVLADDAAELTEIFADNLAGEEISPFDLPRAKNPSGGSTQWEIIGSQEEGEMTGVIEGIILFQKSTRAYWKGEYSGDIPPDCVAPDAHHGIGDPGIACDECPFSKYGSGKQNSQACKLMKHIFILRPGDMLPTLVVVPPSSLKKNKRYLAEMINKRVRYWHVVTRIHLTKAMSKNNQAYAEYNFATVGVLPPGEAAALDAYRDPMLESLKTAPVVTETAGLDAEPEF